MRGILRALACTSAVQTLSGFRSVSAESNFLSTFQLLGDGEIRSVIKTPQGDIWAAGNFYTGIDSDVLLVNCNGEDGSIRKARQIRSTADDYAYGLTQNGDNSLVLVGSTASIDGFFPDVYVRSLDLSGTKKWEIAIGKGSSDYATCVASFLDGSIIVGGSSSSFGLPSSQFLFMRISPLGELDWGVGVGGSGADVVNAVTVTSDQDAIAGGSSKGYGTGDLDGVVMRVSGAGVVQWTAVVGAAGNDEVNSVAVTASSIVYGAGRTRRVGSGADDFLVLSLDSIDGRLRWVEAVGGTGKDAANALSIVGENVIVLGYTDRCGTGVNRVLAANFLATGAMVSAGTMGALSSSQAFCVTAPSSQSVVWGGKATDSDSAVHTLLARMSPTEDWINNCTEVQSCSPAVFNLSGSHKFLIVNETASSWIDPLINTTDFTVSNLNVNEVVDCQSDPVQGSSPSGHAATGGASSTTSSSEAAGTNQSVSDALGITLGVLGGACGVTAIVSIAAWVVYKRTRKPSPAVIPLQAASSPPLTGKRDEGKTKVGKFALLSKITQEEGAELAAQSGMTISFPPGVFKTKFVLSKTKKGIVKLAREIASGTFVAVKKVSGDRVAQSQQSVAIQQALTGVAHVMPLLASVRGVDSHNVPSRYDFMPLAGFGSGEVLKQKLGGLSQENQLKVLGYVATCALEGLEGIHEKGFIHGNVTLSNCVFTSTGDFYFIDFEQGARSVDPTIDFKGLSSLLRALIPLEEAGSAIGQLATKLESATSAAQMLSDPLFSDPQYQLTAQERSLLFQTLANHMNHPQAPSSSQAAPQGHVYVNGTPPPSQEHAYVNGSSPPPQEHAYVNEEHG